MKFLRNIFIIWLIAFAIFKIDPNSYIYVDNVYDTVIDKTEEIISSFNDDKYSYSTMNINYGRPDEPWETEHDGSINVEPLRPGHILYYKMELPMSNPFYEIWQEAIMNWNALGVIKLVQVPTSYNGYAVELSGEYNPSQGRKELASGKSMSIARTNFDSESYSGIFNHFIKAQANLSDKLSTFSHARQVEGAEHEMGHILGFDHDNTNYNGTYAVMNWRNRPISKLRPLGHIEQQALQTVYH